MHFALLPFSIAHIHQLALRLDQRSVPSLKRLLLDNLMDRLDHLVAILLAARPLCMQLIEHFGVGLPHLHLLQGNLLLLLQFSCGQLKHLRRKVESLPLLPLLVSLIDCPRLFAGLRWLLSCGS